ncbi:hypothetical protein [Pseudomonas sp. PIC25]|uniref:hypothetical protein n=1 Tax=Pseudomonas sp. PIC25 TaxID=1958773 RepID=UPI00117AA6BB|nr:hypothetical protein [Pseudomonas sp. PIC25]
MVIGDPSKFAFECRFSDVKSLLGRVYVYIEGRRFGSNIDYELDSFARELRVEVINCGLRFYPELIRFSAADVFWIREELSESEVVRVSDTLNISSDDLDNIFLYTPSYFLDSYAFAMVKSEFAERVYLYKSGENLFFDVLLGVDEFECCSMQLIEYIESRF